MSFVTSILLNHNRPWRPLTNSWYLFQISSRLEESITQQAQQPIAVVQTTQATRTIYNGSHYDLSQYDPYVLYDDVDIYKDDGKPRKKWCDQGEGGV